MKSLKNFRYEPIYFMWYSEKRNLFKEVLDELEVKTDHAYILKVLFAAAEREGISKIIRTLQYLHLNNIMIICIAGLR